MSSRRTMLIEKKIGGIMKFKRAMLIGATTAGLLFLFSVFHSCGQEPPSSPSNSPKVTEVNGLDTQVLGGLVKMLKNNPDKGRVTFYSNSRWQDGMRAFTTFTGYKIDGKMHHEKERKHVLLGDEGVELSGSDTAPGAVEEMLMKKPWKKLPWRDIIIHLYPKPFEMESLLLHP